MRTLLVTNDSRSGRAVSSSSCTNLAVRRPAGSVVACLTVVQRMAEELARGER